MAGKPCVDVAKGRVHTGAIVSINGGERAGAVISCASRDEDVQQAIVVEIRKLAFAKGRALQGQVQVR
jgi:hypothetical protein